MIASIRSELWVHFMHRHMRDTLLFLKEGKHPLPRCPKCDIFFTWRVLNRKHRATVMCARGVERQLKRLW